MPSTPVLEVIEPGLLLTVQDLGRRGFEHLGVPRSGAADPRSLALANELVGNEPGAAALEATLLGPTLRAIRDVDIGLAGADLAAVAHPDGRRLENGRTHRLAAGEILECTEAGDADRGCRLYVAIAGGLDVPVVLGSRSTSLVGSFGGFEGRALGAGDALPAFDRPASLASGDTVAIPALDLSSRLGVLAGPAAREAGGEARLARLLAIDWTVSYSSDRRGLRLEAEDDVAALAVPGDRPSTGMVPGAVQLTPSGQPIVLMPDGGVTGGYAVIAIVASAELPRLGQLVPGASVRFARTGRHPTVMVRP